MGIITEILRTAKLHDKQQATPIVLKEPLSVSAKPIVSSAYVLVTSQPDAEKAVSELEQHLTLGLDIETTGLDPHQHKIRLVQIGAPELSYIFDIFSFNAMPILKPLLENPGPIKVGHNLKFDIKFLLKANIEVKNCWDSMLASQLLTNAITSGGPHGEKQDLGQVTSRILGIELDKTEQKADWRKPLTENMLKYAAIDAQVVLFLKDMLECHLIKLGMNEVVELEMACLPAIARTELIGIAWDRDATSDLADIKEAKAALILSNLKQSFGDNFNPNSPAQVVNALGTANAQKSTLQASNSDNAKAVIDFKETSRQVKAYLRKYEAIANPVTGRLHPEYNQCGTSSGRFGLSKPPLQQTPRDSSIRKLFIPAPGYKFIIADYSAIELRVVADIAQDETMIKAFQKGEDLHLVTAGNVLGIHNPTKDDRQKAKAINFGLIYGQGAEGLSRYATSKFNIEMSIFDARRFRDLFFRTYPGLAKWHRRQRVNCRMALKTKTVAGRTRRFNEDWPQAFFNTPVQGTAADGLKAALILLDKRLRPFGARVVLHVHDEVVVEAPENVAEEVKSITVKAMKEGMERYVKSVPIDVEAVCGDTWADKN